MAGGAQPRLPRGRPRRRRRVLAFWRRTKDEIGGDAESAMEIGEGRTRFIASCGILFGLCFGIVILFQALQPILLASCWRVLS